MSATAGTRPHCQARIDSWRILRITRRTPYSCPSCAGIARLETSSALAIPMVFACFCRFVAITGI